MKVARLAICLAIDLVGGSMNEFYESGENGIEVKIEFLNNWIIQYGFNLTRAIWICNLQSTSSVIDSLRAVTFLHSVNVQCS